MVSTHDKIDKQNLFLRKLSRNYYLPGPHLSLHKRRKAKPRCQIFAIDLNKVCNVVKHTDDVDNLSLSTHQNLRKWCLRHRKNIDKRKYQQNQRQHNETMTHQNMNAPTLNRGTYTFTTVLSQPKAGNNYPPTLSVFLLAGFSLCDYLNHGATISYMASLIQSGTGWYIITGTVAMWMAKCSWLCTLVFNKYRWRYWYVR